MIPAAVEEQVRQRQLRVMKQRATGLLVLVTVVFVVLTVIDDGGGWIGYLRAAAEASMVGGLADWFAVTAIFRHPLGLPIPHTAVITERKEQFGRTLGDFVQANFLSSEVVAERLRASRVVARTAEWLADPENAEKAAAHIVDVAVGLADVVGDDDLDRLVEQEIRRAVEAVTLAPLAGRALRTLVAEGRDQALLDTLLPALEGFLDQHRLFLRARFGEDSPWWLPNRVEGRIFDRLYDGLRGVLRDVQADPDHELRSQLRRGLASFSDRLEHSPELRARGEDLKRQLLDHPAWARWSSSLGSDLKATLRERAAEPGSELRRSLAQLVATAGRRLRDDPELQAKAEHLLESAVRYLAEHYRDDIAALVSTTIARWDATETARKLELLLGRDLQFIRINGTVVGGLAGIVIHAAAEAIG